MKILVTGSSGFVGSSLIKRLVKYETVLYDRNHNPLETMDNKKFLKTKLKGVDVVYHLASISNPKSQDLDKVNIEGTRNLIEAIGELKQNTKIIYSSTFGVYKVPNKGDIISEDYEIEPRNEYGRSKLEAEKLLLKDSRNIILRFSNVYGSDMLPGKHSVIANFVDSLRKGICVNINEKNATRDFIYIDDVVEALLLPMNLRNGGIYNICTGEETSIMDLIKIIEDVTGKKFVINYSNEPNSSGYWKGSYKKANKFLKWKPYVNIVDGITKMLG